MLQQLDGTSGSKHNSLSPTTSPTADEHYCDVYGSKKSRSNPHECNNGEIIDETTPMRLISPRATLFNPTAKGKRCKFPWHKRRDRKKASSLTPDPVVSVDESQHLEVRTPEETGDVQIPIIVVASIRESVYTKPTINISSGSIPALILPPIPIEDIALMDYPVGGEEEDSDEEDGDEEGSDQAEKFWTPSELSDAEKAELPEWA